MCEVLQKQRNFKKARQDSVLPTLASHTVVLKDQKHISEPVVLMVINVEAAIGEADACSCGI